MPQSSCTHLDQIRDVKPSAAGGHPIVRSIEPGERWRWCYVDELLME